MLEWYLEAIQEDSDLSVCIVFNDIRTYTIGRRRDHYIISSNTLVSRNHGIISLKSNNSLYIKDSNSVNGTYINDVQIEPNKDYLLKENDILGIGAPTTAQAIKKELFRVRCKKFSTNSNTTPVINADSSSNNNTNEKCNFELVNIIKSDSKQDNDIVEENAIKKEKNVNNFCQERIHDTTSLNDKNISTGNQTAGDISSPNVDINEICILDNNEKLLIDEDIKPVINLPNSVNNHKNDSDCYIIICSSDEENNDNLSKSTSSTKSTKEKSHKNDLVEEKKNSENDQIDEDLLPKEVIVKTEQHSYSFTQDDENDIIVSSDDDDIFPKSQLFNDELIKTEPDAKQETTSNDENNHCDNIFSSIKKEIIDINYDDSDDDCNIWLGKLSQSQDILSSAQGRSKNKVVNSVKTSDELFDRLIFDDEELPFCDKNEVLEKEKDVRDTVSSPKICEDEEQLQIYELQKADETEANKALPKHTLQKSSSDHENQKDKAPPKIIETKKSYIKPPVIDAPFLLKGKRKVDEDSKSKEDTSKSKKRRSSYNENSSISAPIDNTKLQIGQGTDKKNKQRRKSTGTITKREKQKIQEDRKKKLKELASKTTENKDAKLPKNNTKPKVKLSNSRGSFLTDIEPLQKKKKIEEPEKIEKYKIPKRNTVAYNEPSTSKVAVNHKPFISCDVEKKITIKTKSKNISAKNIVINKKAHINGIKGILKMNFSSKKTSKKQVTFIDTPQIKFYQKDFENNRIQEKGIEVNYQNKILSTILEWVPMWLDEQKRISTSPPITKKEPLRMCSNFNTIGDYVEIVTPLMLLELWKSVFRDWISSRLPAMLACVDSITQAGSDLNDNLYLNCHRVMYSNDEDSYPCRGDLLALEVKLNTPKGKIFVKKFAYVINMFRRRLTPTDIINKNVITRSDIPPDYKVTFTLMTRNFITSKNVTMTDDRLIRIGLVSRIAPPLRVFKSLSYLEKSPLRNFILKPSIQQFKLTKKSQFTFATENNLNNEQRMCVYEAYEICTRNEPGIYMVQGPPGTGKSYVIKHLIRQLLHDANKDPNSPKCRILLCAPSNAAIDEIANSLLNMRSKMNKNERFKMIRLGPPSSIVHPFIKSICVSELVSKYLQTQKHNHIQNNHHMTEECNFLVEKINTLQNTIPYLQERNIDTSLEEQKLKKAIEDLDRFKSKPTIELSYQEKRKIERDTEVMYLKNAEIICSTLSSCVGSRIEELFLEKKLEFTCCIVDEATQSCEQENLIPLMLGINKFVLVGDPKQLPPTTISQEAKDLDYGNSLFSRIQKCLEHFPDNPTRMLYEQYRMHPEICQFPSSHFYGNKLKTSEVVISKLEMILNPYCLFCLNSNIDLKDGEYLNKTEANLVLLLADIVLRKTKYNIGIITPYIIQKKYLMSQYKSMRDKEMIGNRESKERENCQRLVINTVDSFQGQERDVIIISSVRYKSNIFLSDPQRFNVALTRAKHAVFICSHANLFKSKSIWQTLETDAKNRNFFYPLSDKQATDETYLSKLICKQ